MRTLLAVTFLLFVGFQTFFFNFSERLTPSVRGVGVHYRTASYPISQVNEARVNDVRLYIEKVNFDL